MIKKRIEAIYSALDVGFNSLITFSTFIVIKQFLGLDMIGYFGIILSITSFVETIQMGLYERPAYLGKPVGYKNFELNILYISLLIFIPLLIVDRFLFSGHLISSSLFCLTYILIQNIRIYDYINNNVKKVAFRSFLTFLLVVIGFNYLNNNREYVNIDNFLFIIFLSRIFFILIERKKIFIINTKNNIFNNELGYLISSILTLIRSRLPLWGLLPFGLGLVGIYEVFRNILEIYLTPARPVFLVMLKNILRDGPKKIFYFGVFFTSLTLFVIIVSYFYLIEFEVFNINELNNFQTFIVLLIISASFWISETTGIIFQYNSNSSLDATRRFTSILVFLLMSLIFINKLNFVNYMYLVSLMYFIEVLISFYFKEKLKI